MSFGVFAGPPGAAFGARHVLALGDGARWRLCLDWRSLRRRWCFPSRCGAGARFGWFRWQVLELAQRSQRGLHGAGEGGGVGAQSGGQCRGEFRIGGAAERIHDGVVDRDDLRGEHRLERVGRVQREHGQSYGFADGGAGGFRDRGGGDGLDDGCEEMFEEVWVEVLVGGGLGCLGRCNERHGA